MGGFGDDDDDDADSDFPYDSDDSESDLESDQPAPASESGVRPVRQIHHPKPGKRRVRLRPMPPKMRAKYPDTVSITITRTDGRQLIFVR